MENEKIKVKLERYRWPDEIKKEKKKKRRKVFFVLAIILSFGFGWNGNNIANSRKIPIKEATRFDSVYRDLLEYWYFVDDLEQPEEALMNFAINGMLEQDVDPHTSYLTSEEASQLQQSINRDFTGIGVQYMAGDLNVITRVFKDSPAEQSGVKAGDILYSVDGKKIEGLSSDQIQDLILGEEGTEVQIVFLRDGQEISLTITRGKVNALVWGEVIDDVAYLEISSFGSNLAESIKLYLDDFQELGINELIIDLRNNGGGYLQAIQEIAPIFFDNNDIVYQEDFKEDQNRIYNVTQSEKSKYNFKKTVLLLNENSASAAEVFAIAMKENNQVDIIGDTSYGKGTVQMQKSYKDGSVLKVTVAQWLSPSGASINNVGIKPEYEVKLHNIFYKELIEFDDEVKFDSVHESVSYIQEGLSFLGYHHGRTDGYFDTETLNSLHQYQSEHGLEIRDTITMDTAIQIYSSVTREWSQNQKEHDIQLHKAIEVVKNAEI